MTYTDEDLLDALRAFHAEHGHPPTTTEANDPATDLPTAATFASHFGSWNEALDAVGLASRTSTQSTYSKADLLDALRRFHAEHGRSPTTAEADDPATDLPTRTTFRTRFGSWNAAIEQAGFEPRIRHRSDSEEKLLDILREYADREGRPPTSTEVNADETLPSSATFADRFGSWNDALEVAGFEPHVKHYSEGDLRDALREYADREGRPPTSTEANDPATDLPSCPAYRSHFGSWNAALEAAGFEPRKQQHDQDARTNDHGARTKRKAYSEEELLDRLREFATKYGRPPTRTEANDNESLPYEATFRRHFGSWSAAVKAAGDDPRERRRSSYSDDELLDTLRAFHAEHGEPPTVPEINESETMPSATAFIAHFGSWNAAIEQAGLEPRDRRRTDEELLADLRAVAEAGTYPSYNVVADREDMAAPQTYDRRFGSWTEALAAAGLMPVSAEATTREGAEATNE